MCRSVCRLMGIKIAEISRKDLTFPQVLCIIKVQGCVDFGQRPPVVRITALCTLSEGRGRLFLFVMYDEGMDYRDYSANRSDNLENEARYIHFITPPSVKSTERGTQLKKQSVALSAGVFF